MNKYHEHVRTFVFYMVSALLIQVGMKIRLIFKIAGLKSKAYFRNPIDYSCHSRVNKGRGLSPRSAFSSLKSVEVVLKETLLSRLCGEQMNKLNRRFKWAWGLHW